MLVNSCGIRALLLLPSAGAIALAYAYRDQWDIAILEGCLAEVGSAAPLLFIGLYALATVLFLPGLVLTLASGALFGPVGGTLYSLTGATFGAGLAFLVARYLASDWIQARIKAGAGGRAKRLVKAVARQGEVILCGTCMDARGSATTSSSMVPARARWTSWQRSRSRRTSSTATKAPTTDSDARKATSGEAVTGWPSLSGRRAPRARGAQPTCAR